MAKIGHKHILRKKNVRDPLDYFVYFFTFTTPLFELPQAIEIYTRHSAQDVSLLTWGFFCIDNLVWIIYAFHKKIKPLFITSILYEAIELIILVGIITYR